MPAKPIGTTNTEVSRRLIEAREAANMSQDDVEFHFRNLMPSGGWITSSKVSRLERGRVGYTTMELAMLAGLYGVTVSSLSPEAGAEWDSISRMMAAVQSRCFASSSLRKQAAQLVQT